MSDGIHWVVKTEEQRGNFIQMASKWVLPFQGQLREPHHPKTLKQIRYAHSLCNALAAHHQAPPEAAKKDSKVAFGVTVVSTSLVTGDRTARLVSFADYTKEQMEAFCTAMEVYLSENGIEFIGSGDG